ncbi:hypothetical protein BaRGS_00016596, partial [Batillaria attramentaria]
MEIWEGDNEKPGKDVYDQASMQPSSRRQKYIVWQELYVPIPKTGTEITFSVNGQASELSILETIISVKHDDTCYGMYGMKYSNSELRVVPSEKSQIESTHKLQLRRDCNQRIRIYLEDIQQNYLCENAKVLRAVWEIKTRKKEELRACYNVDSWKPSLFTASFDQYNMYILIRTLPHGFHIFRNNMLWMEKARASPREALVW